MELPQAAATAAALLFNHSLKPQPFPHPLPSAVGSSIPAFDPCPCHQAAF